MGELLDNSLTVLLVDRRDGYDGVKTILEAEGHEVVEAHTIEEAFESALDFTGCVRPDVILLNDKSLPAEEIAALGARHHDLALDHVPLVAVAADAVVSPTAQASSSFLTSQDGDNLGDLVAKILDKRSAAASAARR